MSNDKLVEIVLELSKLPDAAKALSVARKILAEHIKFEPYSKIWGATYLRCEENVGYVGIELAEALFDCGYDVDEDWDDQSLDCAQKIVALIVRGEAVTFGNDDFGLNVYQSPN